MLSRFGIKWRGSPLAGRLLAGPDDESVSDSMSVAPPTSHDAGDFAGLARSGGAGEAAFLGGILRIARGHLGTIVLVTLAVCGAAGGVAYLLPANYTASAEVIFDPRKTNGVDPTANGTDAATDPVSVQNQIHIISSRNLAARVIARLGLADDPEFNPKSQAPGANATPAAAGPAGDVDALASAADDRVVDAFLKHLTVQPLGLSTTFSIAFTSRDPAVAAAVANALADAYIDRQIDTKARAARVAETWLVQRVRQLALDTQKAETAVQDYKRAHGINEVTSGASDPSSATPLVDQELVALQMQLVQARAALSEKSAVRASMQSLIEAGNAADLSKVSDSPVIVQLRQQESEVLQKEADLVARYGPKHPKVIAVTAERRNIEAKIATEVDRVARALDGDVAVAKAQVASLEQSLKQAQQLASNENMSRATLESLEANAKSTRTAYEAFVARLRDVQGQEAMQLPDASIISRAPIPHAPNPPSRTLIVAASLPVGVLLGLLAALLQERAAGGETAPAAPRAPATAPALRVAAPIVARIPDLARLGWPVEGIADFARAHPASSFAAAISTLQSRVLRNRAGDVIAVTSASAGAGSALLVLNLARAAAQHGRKVIAIDADPGSPLARLLRLDANRPGLLDVLAGRATLSACVVPDRAASLFILSVGRPSAVQADLLASPELHRLIERLRLSADVVLLNLPAVARGFRQAAAGARAADTVLLLLGWDGQVLPPPAAVNAMVSALAARNTGLVLAE